MKFTPVQRLVAEHYAAGDFHYMDDTDESDDCGDTLFTFCINEAGVAGDGETAIGVLYGFLTTAIGERISLREALP